jgi:hypothetical protein
LTNQGGTFWTLVVRSVRGLACEARRGCVRALSTAPREKHGGRERLMACSAAGRRTGSTACLSTKDRLRPTSSRLSPGTRKRRSTSQSRACSAKCRVRMPARGSADRGRLLAPDPADGQASPVSAGDHTTGATRTLPATTFRADNGVIGVEEIVAPDHRLCA